jgi:hypothetical protein
MPEDYPLPSPTFTSVNSLIFKEIQSEVLPLQILSLNTHLEH